MSRERVSELTSRVLSDVRSYQAAEKVWRKEDGKSYIVGYRWKSVPDLAAILECSTSTAREVLARVELKKGRYEEVSPVVLSPTS